MASYRWAKLEGNFEGFFRSDNGQADPGITSLFDFPTNDPSYTAVGVPQFGYRGDIRYQGTTLGSGRLPNDRPHQFKLYTNYAFGNLNTGLGLNVGSGRSLTALAANPGYTNSGEIPESLRGEGFETVDGFKTRTPTEFYVDLHVDYTIRFGGAADDPARRRLQRARHAGPAGLRQLHGDVLPEPQPGLRNREGGRRVPHPVPRPEADPYRRAIRVVDVASA